MLETARTKPQNISIQLLLSGHPNGGPHPGVTAAPPTRYSHVFFVATSHAPYGQLVADTQHICGSAATACSMQQFLYWRMGDPGARCYVLRPATAVAATG